MLSFVEHESFDENVARFLEYAKGIDSEYGQILSDLSAGISRENLNDRTRMRIDFNAEVVKKLDQVPIDEVTDGA